MNDEQMKLILDEVNFYINLRNNTITILREFEGDTHFNLTELNKDMKRADEKITLLLGGNIKECCINCILSDVYINYRYCFLHERSVSDDAKCVSFKTNNKYMWENIW